MINERLTIERLSEVLKSMQGYAARDHQLSMFVDGCAVFERVDPTFIDCVSALAELLEYRKAVAVPEMLPCPVLLEPGLKFGKGVPTRTMLDALQRRAEYYAELDAMTPEQRAEHDAGIKEFANMLQTSPTELQKCQCSSCLAAAILNGEKSVNGN